MITVCSKPASFTHQLVEIEQDAPVAIVRLQRAPAGHTLNPAALFQLGQAIDQLVASSQVQALVITGSPGAFCRGADVGYFARLLQAGRIDDLMRFTQAGASLFDRIEQSSKPIIAALNGSAIGGGLELALACHRRIAVRAASVALPETGIGIIPGWGGAGRALRQAGVNIAKWMVYTGAQLAAPDALQLGLIDELTTPPDLLQRAKQMAQGESPRPNQQQAASRVDREVIEHTFEGQTVAELLGKIGGPSTDMMRRSPCALQLAEQLLEMHNRTDSRDWTTRSLPLIRQSLESADARIGLQALVQGKLNQAHFVGA